MRPDNFSINPTVVGVGVIVGSMVTVGSGVIVIVGFLIIAVTFLIIVGVGLLGIEVGVLSADKVIEGVGVLEGLLGVGDTEMVGEGGSEVGVSIWA